MFFKNPYFPLENADNIGSRVLVSIARKELKDYRGEVPWLSGRVSACDAEGPRFSTLASLLKRIW